MIEVRERQPLAGKVAVVTGTSRGIGNATALSLARAGASVVGNFVSESSAKKQDKLAAEIQGFGGNFVSVQADITTHEGRSALFTAALEAPFANGGVDVLVLNAAGGFENDKPYGYADLVNHQSQLALVDDYQSLMNRGSEVVFLTSHWAHGYGQVRMLPFYREVARTKHNAEQDLLARVGRMAAYGARLSRISAPLVKETGAHSIFEHLSAKKLQALERKMGGFPDKGEVGDEVVAFTLDPHESGDIYFVRGYNVPPIPEGHVGAKHMDRRQIRKAFRMYDNTIRNRVMVNSFDSSEDRMSGVARYRPRKFDSVGHVRAEYGGEILPAHERLEIGAQSLGLVLAVLEPDMGDATITLDGLSGETDFTGRGKGGFIFTGDDLEIRVSEVRLRGATDIAGRVEMYVDGKEVTSFEQIRLGIIPDKDLALRVTNRARRNRARHALAASR